ncbi:unnamed protein product [Durusdinium trenchii]|uniref:PDZ domain-containing protein n=1 Tax=Durusdinium trenchii TaxID=1381693 RepID=A0ABP0HQW2_9DINO
MMSAEGEDEAPLEAYEEGNVPEDREQSGEDAVEPNADEVSNTLRQQAAGGYVADRPDMRNADDDSKEFAVKIQKLPGMKLGLECVQFEGELVVQGIAEGMVTEEWNTKNPFQAIQVGDVVRQVNQLRGDSKKMLSELRNALVLSLKLEHCSREIPDIEEPKFPSWRRTGGALLRFHQRLELEAALMDQACAIAAISRRHERADLEPKVWEAASAWNLESFMFFEEVPFLAAFGYMAKDKTTWEEGKKVPTLTLNLDEHFEQAGCTWYIIKPISSDQFVRFCKMVTRCSLYIGYRIFQEDGNMFIMFAMIFLMFALFGSSDWVDRMAPPRCCLEVPGDSEAESLTWEAPRRLHHLRMELHDRMKYYMEEAFYARVFNETPFARHMGLPGTTARLKAWLTTLSNAINKQEVPPMAAAITLLFLHTPLPSDEQEAPAPLPDPVKPPRPSLVMAI